MTAAAMSRLAGVVAAIGGLFAALLFVAPAQAVPSQQWAPTVPSSADWTRPDASVSQDPAEIAAEAPADEPLEVVITRETATGPEFETVRAGSISRASSIIGNAQDDADVLAVSMAGQMSIAISNDEYRPQQWALDTLRAEKSWARSRGAGAKVAVIDTGVQRNHPDLAGRTLPGYNATNGTSDVRDFNGHGTHVAGIIAARSNNRIGVAGLAPDAKILPVRVLGADGTGSTAVVARGITWAVRHRAQIINMSLIGENDPSVRKAIEYARSQNVIVVAAAGNSGCIWPPGGKGPTWYPAALPGVIGVGSVDSTLQISSFSSCGRWVDVSAPGGAIMSTWRGSSYQGISGTSMAAPHVSALAAQTVSQIGNGYSAKKVAALIGQYTRDLGPSGRDTSFGSGLIDPVATLSRATAKLRLSASRKAIIAGSRLKISGRLTYADGAPIAGRRVSMTATLRGKKRTYTMVTNTRGAFAKTYSLSHKVRFVASAGAVGNTAASSRALNYRAVRPKWAYKHSRSKVKVANTARYGQTVRLQKLRKGRWHTIASTKVTARQRSWTTRTGRGTWRLLSVANAKLTTRTSPRWRS